MLYVHKRTGEIMEIVAIFLRPNGERMAHCLCDSRLHFGNTREIAKGTVAVDYPLSQLVPTVVPDWDSVKSQYPEGTWDAVRVRKKQILEESLRGSAMSIFQKTYNDLLKSGVADDVARATAEEARKTFLQEKTDKKPQPYCGCKPYQW